jgi:hypothetical protein
MSKIQAVLTTNASIPRILKAQSRPMLRIMAPAANEYNRPPSPEPQAENPLARDRFVVNHWGTIPTEGVNRNPMPSPKRTPCVKNRCQILLAKPAQMRLAVSIITPANIVGFVPSSLTHMVATGDIRSAQLMLREPTKAYCKGVAPGNVLFAR